MCDTGEPAENEVSDRTTFDIVTVPSLDEMISLASEIVPDVRSIVTHSHTEHTAGISVRETGDLAFFPGMGGLYSRSPTLR